MDGLALATERYAWDGTIVLQYHGAFMGDQERCFIAVWYVVSIVLLTMKK